jgi:hypothetical protein
MLHPIQTNRRTRYRTLQEFELVLQCESQLKIFRLLWTARTRGRLWINKTQWLCIAWISVNVLLQVLVALLGLTYSLDTSNWLNTSFGVLSICDLHTIQGDLYLLPLNGNAANKLSDNKATTIPTMV